MWYGNVLTGSRPAVEWPPEPAEPSPMLSPRQGRRRHVLASWLDDDVDSTEAQTASTSRVDYRVIGNDQARSKPPVADTWLRPRRT